MMAGMSSWGIGHLRSSTTRWLRSRRGRVVVASVVAIGVVAAVWLVALRGPAASRPEPVARSDAHSGTASAVGAPTPSPPAPSSSPAPTPAPQASVVGHLLVTAIGVDMPIEAVGTDSQGLMDIPRNPADAGWWQPGFPPGTRGHVVLDGHVHWGNDPGPFVHLDRLRRGDVALVTWRDGLRYTYHVTATSTYAWNAKVPELFGPASQSTLVLITCAGAWDAANQRYPDTLVVQATLAGTE
jgi:sortase (surface protein transpeptidase)